MSVTARVLYARLPGRDVGRLVYLLAQGRCFQGV